MKWFIFACLVLFISTVVCERVILEKELKPFISSLEKYSLTPNAVVFVVDESGSIGAQTYQDVKHFIHLVARRFSVSSEHSRVAVVSFSDLPRTHLNYIKDTQGSNMCNLLKVVDNMDYIGSGTHTNLAMEAARGILVQARPNANKLIILITDGESNSGYSPVDAAQKLKKDGVIIFAVGVANVNVKEVNDVATSKDHIYILKNFDYIKQLNKYLKKETKEVSWDYTPDTAMCDNFCVNKTNCCDSHAKCYCGTLSGDYQCVCDAGYNGTGHWNSCSKCPKGTYKNSLEAQDCLKCPEHSTTPSEGSLSFADCKCQVGYVMAGNYCKPIECAQLNPPEGGVLIPKKCGHTYGARCELKCKEGYCPFSCQMAASDADVSPWNRSPLPSRQCLETGKWTGEDFYCEKMRCPVLDHPLHGKHDCVDLDFEFGTSCQFQCETGYELEGSSSRTCLRNGSWTGTQTACKEIQCDPLKRNQHLKVKPKKCSSEKMPFRSVCRYYCTEGYSLVSENSKVDGINECLFNKTWSNIGQKISCADISPPTVKCPKSITTATDPDKATARVSWKEAQAEDNVFVSDIFIKSPVFIRKPPQAFPIGVTKIVYEAIDSSNNSNSCSFTVTVVDKEPPKVLECPDNIEIFHDKKSGISVTWKEPIFWDNSGQLNPAIKNHRSGNEFSWGDPSPVYYNVTDPSGNMATCKFTVKIKRHPCQPLPAPANGFVTCDTWEDGRLCSVHCGEGYRFATNLEVPKAFECKRVGRTGSKWVPFLNRKSNFNFPIPDCSKIHKRNAVNETIQFNYKVDVCNEEIAKKLKEKFVDTLKNSFGRVGGIICPASRGCQPGNVQISCGNNPHRKFKRSVNTQDDVLVVRLNVAMYPGEDEDLNGLTSKVSDLSEASKNLSQPLLKEIESIATQNVKEVYNVDSIEAPEISLQIDLICSLGQIKKDNSCVDCPAGTYKNDVLESCLDCPHASYQVKINAFSCLPCPMGYTTYEKRSRSPSDCKAPCPAGFYSRTTFEPCQPCPLNTYQEHALRKECFRCPIGLLTWKTGSNSSKDCASPCKPGSYSDTGLEPCSLCDLGFYQSQHKQNTCEICPDDMTTKMRGSIALEHCKKFDVCKELLPCSNYSTCVQIGSSYTCVCPPGMYGKHCEHTINFCEADSCFNGGTCFSKLDGYVCACPEGFSGQNCEINVDDCRKNSCYNNGKCLDLVNDFACICQEGYTGSRCEINIFDCLSDPCHNGGTCFDKVNGYRCCCPPGFAGEHCEKELSPCDTVKCENGGTCSFDGNETLCHCKIGFAGKHCETTVTIDYCFNSTCFNGGSCENGDDSPICKCATGYMGVHCEEEIIPIYSLNFKSPTTSNYAKVESRDLLYAITVSFFMRTQLKAAERRPTPLSYSYYDKEKKEVVDNALTLFDINRIQLYLHGEMLHTGYVANSDPDWHHYAVTWEQKEGKWAFLVDGKPVANGTQVGEGRYFWPGFFVLGQEQDSLGGTFSVSEAFAGDITEFNVWNYAMSREEIASTFSSCGRVGNVVPWQSVSYSVHGSVTVSTDNSLCQEIGTCSEKDCHCFYSTKEIAIMCQHSVEGCDPNPCFNFQPCIVNNSRSFCNCNEGFEGKLCKYDINECLENNGGCSHICINTLGSWECKCPDGMLLSKDGLNCQDTSFCKVDDKVHLDGETWTSSCQECICERGNVQCSPIQCPDTNCHPEQNWVHLPGECCPKCLSYSFCSISSSNTLLMFDYRSIEVSPSCDFTLIEDCVEGQFSLRLESNNSHEASSQSTWQSSDLESNQTAGRNLVIFQDCQNLRILKNGETVLNNEIVDSSFQNREFRVESKNDTLDIWLKSGLFLRWYFNGEILIAVPLDVSTNLCGICGNFQEYHMKKTGYNHSVIEECTFQMADDNNDLQASRSHQCYLLIAEKWLQLLTVFLIHIMFNHFIH